MSADKPAPEFAAYQRALLSKEQQQPAETKEQAEAAAAAAAAATAKLPAEDPVFDPETGDCIKVYHSYRLQVKYHDPRCQRPCCASINAPTK